MPLDAIAWITAVEKYSGNELSIKQPVGSWALDFAELMLSRGVSKIVLSTSLNDVASYSSRLQELQKSGVLCTGAELADIQNAVEEIRGVGALFIYWVGHGIMAPSRQLLCADSRSVSDLRSISADSLLTRLRANEYPRMQIGFFECCAQVVTSAPDTLRFGGDGKTPTRQFFYYAASAGEIATGSTERAGFSTQVLQSLRDSPTFPPDPPTAFFDVLKISLGTIPLQTRPFLQRTEESGDVWSSGDPSKTDDLLDAAIIAGLSQSQFDCLWQPLRFTILRPVEVARAYRDGTIPGLAAALRVTQPLIAATDLLDRADKQLRLIQEFEPMCLRLRLLLRDWLALYERMAIDDYIGRRERIDDLPRLLLSALDQARQEFGFRSFIKLLELAARRARKQEPQAAGDLCGALAKHLLLGQHYASVMQEMPEVNDHLYLLLAVDWEPNTRTAYLMNSWIFPGVSGGFDQQELPIGNNLAEQINSAIQNVIEKFAESPLKVELLVPNELLCAPRELLELTDPILETCTWLEAQHPITLRWRDRMKGGTRYFPGSWKANGLAARAIAEKAQSLSCTWRPPLGDREICNFVGLTFPGPCPSNPGRNKSQFFDELLRGQPYMCWPRNAPQDLESFKNAAEDLLGKSRLGNLPLALRDNRSQPLLGDLVVLIDEPQRNPYNELNHLTETGQRGT